MATKAITRYRTRFVSRPRRRSKGLTIPLAPLAGLAVGMAPVIRKVLDGAPDQAAIELAFRYTGWNGWENRYQIKALQYGLLPLVAGFMVHKYVGGKLGVNAALSRAGIPLFRI